MPTLATSGSAAYDLCTIDGPVDLAPLTVRKFDTGLSLAYMPEDTFILLTSRSGLALHQCCFVQGGVIDSDFRGSIACILYNGSPKNFVRIEKGSRICQALILPRLSLSDAPTPLKRKRGARGFGSSGLKTTDGVGLCSPDTTRPPSCPEGREPSVEDAARRRETGEISDQTD